MSPSPLASLPAAAPAMVATRARRRIARRRGRLLLILVLLLVPGFAGWLIRAQAAGVAGSDASPGPGDASRCGVCLNSITGTYYWISSPALPQKVSVCEACQKLPVRCHTCRLPVNHRGHPLPDGRHLCPAHFEAGVFEERDALRIYEETRRELQGLLAGTGTLPARNIRVALVDRARLQSLNQSLPSAHDDANILGLTRTRVRNKTDFEHDIFLLTGLSPARLAAIAAHEYTHTWIHENVPPDRQLERDSVEGFCELVAYKLMSARNEAIEKQVILANAYTRGQVNAFVQAESTHQFHRIVRWLKTGVDEILQPTNTAQVLAIRPDPGAQAPTWPPPPQRATTVPQQLELRGLSGPAHRRLALINDATLAAGDRVRVRTASGSGSSQVRCLEIRPQSVLVQVEGEPTPRELILRAGAGTSPPPAIVPSATAHRPGAAP